MRVRILLALLVPEGIASLGMMAAYFKYMGPDYFRTLTPMEVTLIAAAIFGVTMSVLVNLSIWGLGISIERRNGRIELVEPGQAKAPDEGSR